MGHPQVEDALFKPWNGDVPLSGDDTFKPCRRVFQPELILHGCVSVAVNTEPKET